MPTPVGGVRKGDGKMRKLVEYFYNKLSSITSVLLIVLAVFGALVSFFELDIAKVLFLATTLLLAMLAVFVVYARYENEHRRAVALMMLLIVPITLAWMLEKFLQINPVFYLIISQILIVVTVIIAALVVENYGNYWRWEDKEERD
jgi:hypothetical protein